MTYELRGREDHNSKIWKDVTSSDSVINSDKTYLDVNSKLDPAHYDETTRAVNTIEYEHHEIHAQSHYFICGFETLADEVVADFVVITPNVDKRLHMTFAIEGTSQTEMRIFEAGSTTGGTPVVSYNNDRNSTNTTGATIVRDPAINSSGTLVFSASAGLAGATPSKAGTLGNVQRNREIILASGTTYIFGITSKQDDNIVSFCGEWYEHTNKSN